MNYRDLLYRKYVSTHTRNLYGNLRLDDIVRQFSDWDWYFRKFLPRQNDAQILDIGCGFGGFVYFLQQNGYLNAQGIDVSEEQIALGKQMGIGNIDQGDIFEFLSDKEEVFDIIFARDVIEHFSRDEVIELLLSVYKSLKFSGTFVIQTPNGESPFSGKIIYGDFTHQTTFTRASLNQVLSLAGFKKTRYYPTGPVPKGLKSVVRLSLWKIIESLLKLLMAIETGSFSGIFTQNVIGKGEK
ncbi:MAG: methyltransferase domain-containing protein [Candidatus Aenigmarchaeota archaeon]|nr:methyltransferase domain-containing protein [Candidatus Aenigmarchaeota archaeon]